jgi:hypothetical protein
VQGPNVNGSSQDFLRTQRPVDGWKITLCRLVSNRPGPASHSHEDLNLKKKTDDGK